MSGKFCPNDPNGHRPIISRLLKFNTPFLTSSNSYGSLPSLSRWDIASDGHCLPDSINESTCTRRSSYATTPTDNEAYDHLIFIYVLSEHYYPYMCTSIIIIDSTDCNLQINLFFSLNTNSTYIPIYIVLYLPECIIHIGNCSIFPINISFKDITNKLCIVDLYFTFI